MRTEKLLAGILHSEIAAPDKRPGSLLQNVGPYIRGSPDFSLRLHSLMQCPEVSFHLFFDV
jgi:hypothetical protein